MTVLTFPSNPTVGQQYDAPNGIQYVYDGVKWIVETTSSSSAAITDSTQDRVAPMFVSGTHEGITFTYDAGTNTMSAEVTAVTGNSLVNGLHTVTLGSNGNITTPAFTIPNAAGTNGQVLKWPSSGSTLVWGSDNNSVSSLVNGLHTVSLGSDGATTFPGLLHVSNGLDGSITGAQGVNIYAQNATPLGLVWSLDDQENLFENDPLLNAITTSVQFGIAGLAIEVNPVGGGGVFTFAPNKTLRLPPGGDIVDSNGNTVLGGTTYDQSLNTTDSVTFNEINSTMLWQNNAKISSPNGVNVPGATPTVVFATPNWFTSIKLVIAVEGRLDGDGTFVDHTQTCEATIAATYNTSAEPIMSVYGIVYTSPTPLATFTVARNGITGNIEVTAVNSQTTNAMNVRVQALQFVSRYD